MSDVARDPDELGLAAMDLLVPAFRHMHPALLAPERIAATAAIVLEDAGMLRPAPIPVDIPCSKCGHPGELHAGAACCRGEGPPAYGACKCGSYSPRLAVVQ